MIDTVVQGLAASSVATGAKGYGFLSEDDAYYWNLLTAGEQDEAREMEQAHTAQVAAHKANKPADRWSDEYTAWNLEADRIRKAGRGLYLDFVVRLWGSGRVSH